MPTVDEILALDQLTLRDHTEQAGDVLDTEQHRERIERALPISKVCTVRREGALIAYAMMQPESDNSWFVTAFNTHPKQRSASVLRELFSKFARIAHEAGVVQLKSHVYKTNRLSISFHRRLGFRVTKENGKAVEFVATLAELRSTRAVVRSARKVRVPPPTAIDG